MRPAPRRRGGRSRRRCAPCCKRARARASRAKKKEARHRGGSLAHAEPQGARVRDPKLRSAPRRKKRVRRICARAKVRLSDLIGDLRHLLLGQARGLHGVHGTMARPHRSTRRSITPGIAMPQREQTRCVPKGGEIGPPVGRGLAGRRTPESATLSRACRGTRVHGSGRRGHDGESGAAHRRLRWRASCLERRGST